MSPALDYEKVAELYDAYVVFTDDIPFFVDECRRASGPILELMSGTGRVSIPLVEAGVELTCTDSSSQMLDVLRRKLGERGLQARVLQRDARDLGLEARFPLVILPFQSFGELVTKKQQRAALHSIHAVLAPSGQVID